MVVPEHVTKELIAHVRVSGGRVLLSDSVLIAHAHRRVALCFVDICDFTAILSTMSPHSAVRFLDEFFTLLDGVLDRHAGVSKIKTIGDAYFAAAGLVQTTDATLLSEREQEANACAYLVGLIDCCLDMHDAVAARRFWVAEKMKSDTMLSEETDSNDVEKRRLRNVLKQAFTDDGYLKIRVRIGIHCGDVVAGVVGKKQPVSGVRSVLRG